MTGFGEPVVQGLWCSHRPEGAQCVLPTLVSHLADREFLRSQIPPSYSITAPAMVSQSVKRTLEHAQHRDRSGQDRTLPEGGGAVVARPKPKLEYRCDRGGPAA